MSRRRILIVTLAVLLVLVLPAPLWSGYFGPTAVTYVTTWRPWRSELAVQLDRTDHASPQHAWLVAEYSDPWPGEARTPGHQTVFVTVERHHPLLPWTVTERGTGP